MTGSDIRARPDAADTTEAMGAMTERSLGVVGGLGALAGADFLVKLIEATETHADAGRFEVVFEQRPFAQATAPRTATTARMLYIYDMIDGFRERRIGAVALPCFLSHTFMEELKANSPLPIADMLDAHRAHIRKHFPQVRRIGVLTSRPLREQRLFERYFSQDGLQVLHPQHADGRDSIAEAVYGEHGIARGGRHLRPLQLLREACADLVEQGAQLIVPGVTELALVVSDLGPVGVPILDPHRVYARYVVNEHFAPTPRLFKLGVVGGVGPAATVDFLEKVVRNTPAKRDQDHLQMLVEQNPQIPDRTEHLVGEGPDPTLALYATCKKLQGGGADLIAIPCNTAHAFVEEIQSHLRIPIMNMLTVTVNHVRESFPNLRKVGLLATSGTISSGVYRRALEDHGLEEVVPPPALQARVMDAIYGPKGVKAGFTSGECQEDVLAAIDDLAGRGVNVIILGCTELPLLFQTPEVKTREGRLVKLVDPTDILAKRCVDYALAHSKR
jgi:aspartate racemase